MGETIPDFPRVEVTVGTDGNGSVAINGVVQRVAADDERDARAEVLRIVTSAAADVGHPLRVTAYDSVGRQLLAVSPDGRVEPLTEASGAIAPAPVSRRSAARAERAAGPPAMSSTVSAAGAAGGAATPNPASAAPDAAPTGPLPTLDDLLRSRPAQPVDAADMGWRRNVRYLTGGLLKPGPGAAERAHRDAVERVQQSLRGPRTIVVINPKGGAHKTTTTFLLAAAFGMQRGGSVLAWDNNETRGTLGWRAQPTRHANTAVDLLRDLDRFNDPRNARVGDLDNYVRRQGSLQFDVLASDEDAAASSTIDSEKFTELHATMSRFYRVIVVDTGNNMRASNWEAAVDAADQLVVVSTVREDTAASAAWLIDGLRDRGHDDKVRHAVTVLASPSTVSDRRLTERLHSHFSSLTRRVVAVPHDPALVDGGPINHAALASTTRESWLHVAAAVADGL